MHDQWEYKLLSGTWSLRDAGGMKYGPLTQELLNRLGKEGWEVCSYTYTSLTSATLILKRKLGSA